VRTQRSCTEIESVKGCGAGRPTASESGGSRGLATLPMRNKETLDFRRGSVTMVEEKFHAGQAKSKLPLKQKWPSDSRVVAVAAGGVC
jgi:hypothetical protein